jgi:hypothetical protein
MENIIISNDIYTNCKTVNEFFRQFVKATGADKRISIKNYAQTHLSPADSLIFLNRCIDYVLRVLDK